MLKGRNQHQNEALEISKNWSHYLMLGLCLVAMPLTLSSCSSPTQTKVSIEAEIKLAPDEAIVLFPDQHGGASVASREFVRCVSRKLTETANPYPIVMDTAEFQDAMFPWFEPDHAPQRAAEMDRLLSKTRVRERIASLNVRYLISMALLDSADGFPGMLCGVGYGGAGCLGIAWEDRASQLSAIVWDLKTGQDTGELSVSSSGKSLALGVIIPIIFTAHTEENACEALASKLGEFIGGGPGIGSSRD